jgi:hypothetical protein
MDEDWGFIRAVSWPHGRIVSSDQAISELKGLRTRLSKSILPELVEQPLQLMQVWYEPAPIDPTGGQRPPSPVAILTLVGTFTMTPQTTSWSTVHAPGDLLKLFSSPGRLLIRIHMGLLMDVNKRQFSASLEALLGATSVRVPGGVFESWFFIK